MEKRLVWLLAALGALVSAAACGDDDGGGGPIDAAPRPDAEDDIDAAEPTLLRSGTVAIFEARVDDPDATAGGAIVPLSGGTVSINFFDTATGDVVAEDLNNDGMPDSNIGGCAVRIIDVGTETESTSVDEGTITVSGTGVANGEFACAFNATAETYVCQSTDAAANGVVPIGATAVPQGGGAVLYTFAGANFPAVFDGMAIQIDGFPTNGNGRFPILAVAAPTSLVVFNPAVTATETTTAAGTYATFIGPGPIPQGHDFLTDGGTVSLAGPVGGAIVDPWTETTACAAGCNFTVTGQSGADTVNLSDESGQVAAFPTTPGTPITFDCMGTNGICGNTVGGGSANAFIVSGETTDATLPPANPASPADDVAMPDPVNQFATFQCAFIGATSGTIPAAAVDAILAAGGPPGARTGPTRIQTQVIIAGGAIATNPNQEATSNILQGHATVGFTTLP